MTLVLIVDDSEPNRKLERDILRRAGFETLESATGAEALTLAGEHAPDVILMDLRLPDIDGAEVTRRLAADPRTAGIPVVAISALPLEGSEDWLQAAGFRGLDREADSAWPGSPTTSAATPGGHEGDCRGAQYRAGPHQTAPRTVASRPARRYAAAGARPTAHVSIATRQPRRRALGEGGSDADALVRWRARGPRDPARGVRRRLAGELRRPRDPAGRRPLPDHRDRAEVAPGDDHA